MELASAQYAPRENTLELGPYMKQAAGKLSVSTVSASVVDGGRFGRWAWKFRCSMLRLGNFTPWGADVS